VGNNFKAIFSAVAFCALCDLARGDDQAAIAIVDKAIAAHGGEQRLRAVRAFRWESEGTMNPTKDPSAFTNRVTVQGLDRYRAEFEWGFNGAKYKTVTALNGDRAWRQSNNRQTQSNVRAVAELKHVAFVHVVTTTLVPLKSNGVKLESAGEAKVGDKLAAVVRVTGPDGRKFTLWFDRAAGFLLKLAEDSNLQPKVTVETTFDDYVKFGGVYKAKKISQQFENGERFRQEEITRFQILDKVGPKTFEGPT
jgi:hypothetical protein